MPRSLWKIPFSNVQLLKKNAEKRRKQIWSRCSTILPDHLAGHAQVYNGKSWVRVQVVEQMIGHKYGEFASTRKKTVHKLKSYQRVSRKK